MPKNTVQSVIRALTILEAVADADSEVGVTELANMLNLHKSTVHRLLNTLVYKGYIEQNPETEGYKLGIKAVELGSKVFNRLELRGQTAYLQELMQEIGETVHLVIRNGDQGVYIDKVETRQTLRMYSEIGNKIPLYCTAVGKVLLSYLSKDELEKIYKGIELIKYTPNTITDWAELLDELARVRKDGYAVDNEEYEQKIRCVAAPVKNHKGQVIAAVSVSGPAFRITKEKVGEIAVKVKEKALLMSKNLGYTVS